MKQPAKATIKVDTILASTIKSLQEAQEDVYPAPFANSAMFTFVDALAQVLCTAGQQQQVHTILELWKQCRYSVGDRSRSADLETQRSAG